LASGAASQLVVDAARVVVLGAHDVKPAQFNDFVVLFFPAVATGVATAQHDICAAARHVGGHGDRIEAARLGDDGGLVLVVLGVKHLVRDSPLLQALAQVL